MLTDTSTFSSSDGKRAYKKTTVTTTTTIESTEPRSPVATSTSRSSSSNWSCGWDAPLISEPTLSSLPTYTFDSDHDKRKKHAKADKKDRKNNNNNKKNQKGAKKADGREVDRKSGHKAQTQRRPKRRPTDAETDAEIYRTDRAADPWLSRRPRATHHEGRLVSSATAENPWSRDIASEADAATSVYHSSDDHAAVANTSSWPLIAHKDEASDQTTTPSPSSAPDDQDDITSASADSSAFSATVDRDHAADAIDADEGDEYDVQHIGADHDSVSHSSASSSVESTTTTIYNNGTTELSSASANDTGDYHGRAHDSRRHANHIHDDSSTATAYNDGDDDDSSSGGGDSQDNGDFTCRCWCHHDLAHDESQPTGTLSSSSSSSTVDRDNSAIDASSWEGPAVACACHCASTHDEWPVEHEADSATDASVSSSTSFSSSAVGECARVKIDRRAKKPRDPPVYIRACHRVSTHRRGSLCDDDDAHGLKGDYGDDEHPTASGSTSKDGVVETTSVTVAEPAVRPCEPDAPHAIYGRPRHAHCGAKPSAPVVVAPGVCDLPGGATESFCALGATYTLLAGAVDTRCRVEAALVTLQPRACAQPCFVFAGSDVSFVGVSGNGAITINGRTYPLTATAYFYVRAGSAFAVSNSVGTAPLVFVQQFVGAAAGLGFYREVATYEASVGGAVNVDPRVVEAIGAHYHVRAASGPGSCSGGSALGNRWNAFVPPGVVRFVPTPLCEGDNNGDIGDDSEDNDGDGDDDESTSVSSSSCSTATDDSYGVCEPDHCDDDRLIDDSKDAGLDSWGLRRRQLLVLAATGPCHGTAAHPAATVRPTDLDAFVAVGALGSRVTVRATIIRDPRFGGCPDVLARPTINGGETITLATGVSYWTYYDEEENNVIVQSLPGSRLLPTVPQPFGVPQMVPTPFAASSIVPGLPPVSGLPPIAVRPLPFA